MVQSFRHSGIFLDRIYRINWISFFGRFPEENGQNPIASGEGISFKVIRWHRKYITIYQLN